MGSCTVAAKELESTCRVEWLWKVILCLELQELSSGKGRGTCRMRKRKGIKKSLSMLSHAPDFQFSRMLFEIIQQLLLQNQLLQNLLQLL